MPIKRIVQLSLITLFSSVLVVNSAETKSNSTNNHLNSKALNTESLSEQDWYHLVNMGPLEMALRLLKEPEYPTWRLRLALYPVKDNGVLNGYRITADRINLSPQHYKELVEEYGKGIADPAMNNHAFSDRHQLNFAVIQNNPSDFISEDTQYQKIKPEKVTCGLLKNCSKLFESSNGSWSKPKNTTLEKAPWDKKLNTTAALARALAKEAGWLTSGYKSFRWQEKEAPEGLNQGSPWVEVVIDNYVGNGGGYRATWHELVADDSISKELYSVYFGDGPSSLEASIEKAVVCSRGDKLNTPVQKCM